MEQVPGPVPVVPTVASGGTRDIFPGTLQAVQRSAGHSGDGGYTGHLARVIAELLPVLCKVIKLSCITLWRGGEGRNTFHTHPPSPGLGIGSYICHVRSGQVAK